MYTKDSNGLQTYNDIAESWYNLRHWTRFESELKDLASRWGSGKLLNIGCAHGPDFIPFNTGFDLWGLDSSEQMIKMAVKHTRKFKLETDLLIGDAACLPFSSASFDWVISIATYHHLKGKQQQEAAFRELRRVMKKGGEAFITVWNRWQRDFWGRGREVLIPWKAKEKEVMRYYYLFTYPEIETMVKKAGFTVLKTFSEDGYRLPFKYFSRNICVLAGAD